jgi:hypothetical protein
MLRVRASHALFWYLDNLAVARWNISFFDPGRDLKISGLKCLGAPIGTNNDFEVMLRVRASHALFWYLDNLAVARWEVSLLMWGESTFVPRRGSQL